MTTRKLILLATLVTGVASGGANRLYADTPGDTATVQKTQVLLSEEPADCIKFVQQSLREREETITQLIDIIKNAKDDAPDGPKIWGAEGNAKYQAAELLGNMRATNAIDVLSNNLLYLPKGEWVNDQIRFTQQYYVCAVALARIGEPSIDTLMRKIEISASEEERNLSAWVIMQIEGKEQTLHRLRSALKGEIPEAKSRIKAAMSYLKNYKLTINFPGKPLPWDEAKPK